MNYKKEGEHGRNSFGPLPQGKVNEKPQNHEEKTTSSVLTVLLLILDLNAKRINNYKLETHLCLESSPTQFRNLKPN